MKRDIFSINESDWQEILSGWKQQPFRRRQILHNLFQRLEWDPNRMTEIPDPLRMQLKDEFSFTPLQQNKCVSSSDKHTWKFLFLSDQDNAPIETVRMSYDRGETVCISTQSGCGMGCVFCATGKMGLQRSLSPGEILFQALWIERLIREEGKRLTNIVLMGMGEPFVNYESTVSALRLLQSPEAFGMGSRRMTVSTVGILPGIRKFSAEKGQVNLAVSLHAADNELRNQIVPINKNFPLEDLFSACDDYIEQTNRRITFEWALIDGCNDAPEQAQHLSERIHAMKHALTHVNLIPLNPIKGYSGKPTSPKKVSAFQKILETEKIPNTIRVRRGMDIGAGCGQLVSALLKRVE